MEIYDIFRFTCATGLGQKTSLKLSTLKHLTAKQPKPNRQQTNEDEENKEKKKNVQFRTKFQNSLVVELILV